MTEKKQELIRKTEPAKDEEAKTEVTKKIANKNIKKEEKKENKKMAQLDALGMIETKGLVGSIAPSFKITDPSGPIIVTPGVSFKSPDNLSTGFIPSLKASDLSIST